MSRHFGKRKRHFFTKNGGRRLKKEDKTQNNGRRLLRMYSFEVKQAKIAKRCQIERFTKWLSGIFHILSTWTSKIKNVVF